MATIAGSHASLYACSVRDMARLFAYGTLMCPDIFEKITGQRPVAVSGRVKNHRCLCVRGEQYPGMVRGQGGEVAGLVYTFASYLWPRLDAFEGEQYMRKPVTVWYESGKRELVHSYIFRPEYRRLLTRAAWDYEAFLNGGREAFMASYIGWETTQRNAPKGAIGLD